MRCYTAPALRCPLTGRFRAGACEACATFALRLAAAGADPPVTLATHRRCVAYDRYLSTRWRPRPVAEVLRLRHAWQAAAGLERVELLRAAHRLPQVACSV